MPQIKPDIETFAKIKVIGVGGSGGSAVNRMLESKIKGVEFVALNTDVQALHHNRAPKKLHIGKTVTRGLGSGMNPELGRKSAEESQNDIRDLLKDTDMVFITCGLGGGTGSGASPVVAEIARDLGVLTVAVVTKPFTFEGPKRSEIAEEAWDQLAQNVDTIITIPNDKVLQIIDKKTTLLEAFKIVDDTLRQGVQGISELITIPGLINVDFADVKTIMQDTGSALMGIGEAEGEDRATKAAEQAISSPLLELSIEGASGILFTIAAGEDLTMEEVNDAAKIITNSASDNAKIIFGAVIDQTLGNKIKISVVATGFDDRRPKRQEKREDSPSSIFSAGFSNSAINPVAQPSTRTGFASSNFLRKYKKQEEESEEKFKGFIQKEISPAEEKKEEERQPKPPADDLEIPAFIRRKMGN